MKHTYQLQVKESGVWKTIRTGDDADYLKLIGDRHWARYAKRRVLKVK